jgi:hypothetical protein
MAYCNANVRFWPKADIPLPLHGMAWTLLGYAVIENRPILLVFICKIFVEFFRTVSAVVFVGPF